MAESNPTQVILTDDGIKIIKAQSTANNAASQASKADSAALIAQSKANAAKSAADSSYKYANSEMAVQSTATAKAQKAADDAFSKAQSVGSQASAEIAVQSTATVKAQSKADDAFSKAQAVGSQASKEIAVQSTATAKAQSKADDAFSKAISAIDNGEVTSQAVTDLKGGSKLTIAELENGLATKVANSEYASYKTQTASQIAQKVDNGAFSAYQQTTADLISSKVATKDFSAYQDTTAKAISSKVESKDFNTYKTQTADTISEKVANKDFSAYQDTTSKAISSKVESNDFNTYKTQAADLIADKVANKDFSTYKTQTSDLISQKVSTKDFSAYQATTAKSIESKVESKDFNTYKSQTDKAILSKVSSIDFNNLTISNRNLALGTATPIKIVGKNINNQAQVGYGFSKVIPRGTVVTVAFDVSSSTGVGEFAMQFYGSDSGSSWQNIYSGNLAKGTKHISATLTTNGDHLHVYPRLDNATGDVTFSNFIISESSKEVSWTPAPEDQATQSQFTQLSGEIEQKVDSGAFSSYKTETANLIGSKVSNGDFSTYKKQTAALISEKVATKDFSAYQATTSKLIESKVESSDFNTYKSQTDKAILSKVANSDFSSYKSQTANDINLRVATKDLIDQINLQAGNTLISSSGQLTLSGKNIYFDTDNPVIIPSANITGTLNGKTITGSVINGTTFNAGDIISSVNNTAKYYPMTITSDGAYKSTYFDKAVGLQSSVESGAISYKYRSMIGNGNYLYDNVAINGQGITLDSGTTTTKDTTFNSPEKETAYISLTTEAGLYLHGSNANIDFGGHLEDDSTSVGMYMNPYGNIIAKSASRYWQISVAGNGNAGGGPVAKFGIDSARAYNIEFNRELDIGNFHINTGHTFTSADGGAIHFAKGRGGAADIYAGTVHYNSLTKSSLLSVKKDVQKANTAYWAQLVNSIDLATYQYKTDDNTSNIRLSSIVDDVNDTKQWQLPDVFISRDENGKLSGVDDSVLLNAILATVQEQQKEIDQLNGHNMELEAKLNKLEAKLNG